jgi:hypothetical protein
MPFDIEKSVRYFPVNQMKVLVGKEMQLKSRSGGFEKTQKKIDHRKSEKTHS